MLREMVGVGWWSVRLLTHHQTQLKKDAVVFRMHFWEHVAPSCRGIVRRTPVKACPSSRFVVDGC